ncbi:MAG: dTDP-glucose 4,6-dehydratase [Patescibacteria group bacterium]
MRILVTGGAGFIGSNFIRYWLSNHQNDSIVNFDALTYAGNPENLRDIENHPGYKFVHGNICDSEALKKSMEDVDTVVHFAAESHVDRSIADSDVFIKTNVLGTHKLLEEIRCRGDQIKRFHHISTDEVFGALPLSTPDRFHENTLYKPRSPYSASKAASDHLCRAYFHTHDLPVTISNCSNNYGPYMFPEKFIPVVILNALEDKPIPIYGDGLYVRDWIHVMDHCRGIEAILERGRIGETYCLGGEYEPSNLEVVKTVLEILNKPLSLITHVQDRQGHDRRYSIDDSKARRELEWRPQISFRQGLIEMIDWYKDNESWWRPLMAKSKF